MMKQLRNSECGIKIRNPKSEIRNENGVALIIIVAIIAILSAIGVTFMYEMRLEEKAAFNYMNSLKASYIAKSGIEHAIAVLKQDGGDTGCDWYREKWGYDTNYLPPVISVFGGSEVNLDDTTVTNNLTGGNESKWIYVADDNGDTVGRYAVLILDESSKININTAGNVIAQHGWKPFEISLEKFLIAGGWSLGAIPAPQEQTLANRIVNYRQGSVDGMLPWQEAGSDDIDDDTDNLIYRYDGIDNDADGDTDEINEGVDEPDEFILWKPYSDDWPFITTEEIKNINQVGSTIFNNLKPYITVYSSDENTNDSGFIRMNINLVKDAMALYTVMYDAWDDLTGYTYDEIRRLAAQCAVNTIDYADTDNVSTFLEISDGTDTTIARGVEGIRINEIMVKPAYQWEAEDLFKNHLGADWDIDTPNTGIYSITPSVSTKRATMQFYRAGHYRVRALTYDDCVNTMVDNYTDNSFNVCIYDDKGNSILGDTGDTVAEHNIGGWLLENLGVVEVKETGTYPIDYQIELRTSDKVGIDTPARLDYIQFSQQPDCEYVELVNISDRDIDIGEWVLTTSGGFVGTIPDGTTIERKSYLVLVVDRDNSWAFMEDPDVEEGVRFTAGTDNISFKDTWGDFDNVVQLALSAPPVDIAENVFGDTIVLSGSIFTDSPLLTPEQLDDSGTVGSASSNTLTSSSSPGWTNNELKGSIITASGQARMIISNTPTMVTISDNWDLPVPASGSAYYIHFTPAAVTLWKGTLANQRIVAQVNYSASDIEQVCYIQDNEVPVYGFVALEKNDPTAISDGDRDGVDDWWLLNDVDIEKPNIPGGTPGEKNSAVPNNKEPGVDIEVRNLPFATIGALKEVSTSDTTNEWSKIGYDGSGAEDIELIKRLTDKITVSEKRLEAENYEERYYDGSNDWIIYPISPAEAPDETFLTPYYSTSGPPTTDTGTWIWGIDQRINPDTAFYTLYISGKVLRTIDDPDTMLVKVTTGVEEYETRELSFSPDNIAEYGQIAIGGGIPDEGGDTALLRLEIWKDYPENTISFDAAILAPEYRTYGRININTADTPVLQALPEITLGIADAIVIYRENTSPFDNIGEILDVPLGINPAITLDTFSKISNLITTKSKVFTIISQGQALRKSDKGTVEYPVGTNNWYEILGDKKYIVVMER